MITLNYFPGGVHQCLTFSFDDAGKNDLRLSKLFNKYSLKCTFNICECFMDCDEKEFYERYNGHEIACHGVNHLKVDQLSDEGIINEIFENRKNLEKKAGYIVSGLAYAGGFHDDRSIEMLKKCGISYGRTTLGTGNFYMPKDFMHWHPTCHQSTAEDYIDSFLTHAARRFSFFEVFYIWGHSYEFNSEEEWERMEQICKRLSGNENVWYATNGEIYNYIKALERVRVSADESFVFNPNSIDVWVGVNEKPVMIPAGETVKI